MPEETKAFVHLPVPSEAGKHSGHKIRGKLISKKEGISSLFCVDHKVIITFLFAKEKGWNLSKARSWLKSHLSEGFFSLDDDGKAIFEVFDKKGKLVESREPTELLEAEDKEVESLMNKDRTIFMFGGIGEWTAEIVIKKLLAYDKMDDTKPITLIIGSYGGGVYPSFAIIDTMEYVKAPVNTIGLGWVMSGGLLIFMAGDNRQISQTASILSHRFSTFQGGSQAELKAAEVENKRVHARMVEHYIKFSNLNDVKEVEAQLLQETDTWLTADESIGFELADDYFDRTLEVSEALNRRKNNRKKLIEEAKRGGSKLKGFIETVKIDYMEGDGIDEPFTFGGKMLKIDHENENGRVYPKNVVDRMVNEANQEIELITIEMGHPKDSKDTSPEREIGHLTSLHVDDDGVVHYEGEVYNTSLGKDAQVWLRSKPEGTAEVSLRANGQLKRERSDGAFRERVIEGHLLGVDLVKKGGFGKYARVSNVSESDNNNDTEGSEIDMNKKELLELDDVQELIESAKEKAVKKVEDAAAEVLAKEIEKRDTAIAEGKDKIKELETLKATAETERDTLAAEKAEGEIDKYKQEKINEAEVAPKIKELLNDRVEGTSKEEIDESIKSEIEYISKMTPLLKEAKVHGVPPKENAGDGDTKTKEQKIEEMFSRDPNWAKAKEMK